jgi:hypothetical protein
LSLVQYIDFIPQHFSPYFIHFRMFSNLVAALAVASLATANPLIARQAADSVSAPQPTLVTTTIAGTCITPWLTASLKAGKAKTINLTKTVKTSSIAVVTTTKTATVTPSYIRSVMKVPSA